MRLQVPQAASEISLDDVTKAVRVPIRHVLPNDYRGAMTAANKGQPIASTRDGRLSESFYTLAASLAGTYDWRDA